MTIEFASLSRLGFPDIHINFTVYIFVSNNSSSDLCLLFYFCFHARQPPWDFFCILFFLGASFVFIILFSSLFPKSFFTPSHAYSVFLAFLYTTFLHSPLFHLL